MSTHSIEQIKIFLLEEYKNSEEFEKDINDHAIEQFTEYGNYPRIETNSKFVSVVCERLVKIDR